MSEHGWKWINRLEWPDCKVVGYEDNGVEVKVYMSDLLLVSDGTRVVTGHFVDGVFCCELAQECVVKWRPVPGWLLKEIKGGKLPEKWYRN